MTFRLILPFSKHFMLGKSFVEGIEHSFESLRYYNLGVSEYQPPSKDRLGGWLYCFNLVIWIFS
jgi:hypothetical protein